MRVLVVEDSDRLRESLVIGLRGAGYAIDEAAEGERAIWMLRSSVYDVVVLDLMLPGIDGMSLLRHMRKENNDASVIVLTAKDRLEDKIAGLHAGADDYLVKPFAFDELLARVQAMVRRKHGRKAPTIEIGMIRINTAGRTVFRGKDRVELSSREYAALEYLVIRRGQVVSRTEIEAHIYDDRVDLMSNVVDTVIYALRKKIDSPGAESLIRTRRGMGYAIEQDLA